ncbi:putative bifunctional diguanylate cyclase/phosphodiesterase [Deinococcus koreensis]|uniref:Diguanylate cyclase n=1 Tax=Deinococcus koreensis TaxID=2054903 RepID=A0A2K3UZN6_9DEIO|nr:EAL domain-containing protein [Deinococcus koreensis]PNY81999.1 hypothetical protein CVO96_12040 [Deinococcus koreensis]
MLNFIFTPSARSWRKDFLYTLPLTALYQVMMLALFPLLTQSVAMISLLWVPAWAFLLGTRAGLFVAVGTIIVHQLTFALWRPLTDLTVGDLASALMGALLSLLGAVASGGLRKLLIRLRSLEVAVHSTTDGIAITDLGLLEEGPRLHFANSSFLQESGQALGAPALSRFAGQIDPAWQQELGRALDSGGTFVRQLSLPGDAGQSERVVELRINGIRDGRQRPSRMVLVQRDVTAYKRLEQRLLHQAQHDPLTGLPNRAAFEAQLEGALQRAASPFAVLLLDLDGFKLVNDTLGHGVGDELLIQVGQRLRYTLRPNDLVARLGGDEFVVVTSPLAQEADAQVISERILKAFHDPFEIAGQELHVRTSVGVSLWPADGQDGSSLLKHADLAMYCAKQAGKNEVRFFASAMHGAAQEQAQLERRLRRALDSGAFRLHYQPVVTLGGAESSTFEALLRWTDAELGPVEPDRFIPAAESSGLIVPLGHWVLEEACRQLRGWHDAGHESFRVSVNVSPLQFEQATFVDDLTATLERHGVSPAALTLELTERLIVRDLSGAQHKMKALRACGVEVWIDDLGAGQTALSYLLRLPLSGVKIDRSFVQTLDDTGTGQMVQAMVALARALKLGVVAEGVETPEQLRSMQTLGCEQVQGFLLGRPMPAEAVVPWVGGRALEAQPGAQPGSEELPASCH